MRKKEERMNNEYSLKVQGIISSTQKPRPYVYMPIELSDKIGLTPGEEVEWELIEQEKLRLLRNKRAKGSTNEIKYPLRIQAIRSKGQKQRLYVNIPVPLAAAIKLKLGERVKWALDGRKIFLVRKS